MISYVDFEKLWFLYKTDRVSKGISINAFCVNQGVSYTQFNSWFRRTQKSVDPVVVEGVHSKSMCCLKEGWVSRINTPKRFL